MPTNKRNKNYSFFLETNILMINICIFPRKNSIKSESKVQTEHILTGHFLEIRRVTLFGHFVILFSSWAYQMIEHHGLIRCPSFANFRKIQVGNIHHATMQHHENGKHVQTRMIQIW